jgi:hypothetical protein
MLLVLLLLRASKVRNALGCQYRHKMWSSCFKRIRERLHVFLLRAAATQVYVLFSMLQGTLFHFAAETNLAVGPPTARILSEVTPGQCDLVVERLSTVLMFRTAEKKKNMQKTTPMAEVDIRKVIYDLIMWDLSTSSPSKWPAEILPSY